MEKVTLILSAIAAFASILSVILMLKGNHDNKKQLRHRLEALDEEYNGFFGHMVDDSGRDKVRVEMNTLKKDLNIRQ